MHMFLTEQNVHVLDWTKYTCIWQAKCTCTWLNEMYMYLADQEVHVSGWTKCTSTWVSKCTSIWLN